MIDVLPTLNALLNFTSAVFLFLGRKKIQRGDKERHKTLMLSAFLTSIIFFISYITYHFLRGSTKFSGTGFARTFYVFVLTSHTVLATAVPFLACITLYFGWKGRFSSHQKLARWTFPIWLYVSVTGVIIYVMLYHLFR
jgi:uncharacterized membrane protein YozB (DUF420 family)